MTSSPPVRPNGVLTVLAAAGIVAALMQTLVVPLLGELPQLLHTSPSNATWAVTATLLAAAVTTPISGRLGDLYGKRLMLLVCTAPLVLGSMLCAVASSLAPMVIGRGLQGMGMGIVPLGISALRDLLPPERLGSSIALMSSSMGVGAALGLPIAATVAEQADWRALFWAAAGLSGVVAVLIWRYIPNTSVSAPAGRFDYPGAVGLGIGLVCLLLAVSKGATWGWTSGTILELFAAAAVVLAVWGWWELRSAAPLVDLRVAARPEVLLTNAASIVVGFAMYAQGLVVPQLMQLPEATGYGLGQSMVAMGLWMAPAGLVMTAVSPWSARLTAARGAKITLCVGSLVMAAGYGVCAAGMGSLWGLTLGTCLGTAGVGLAYGAMPALIMGAVPLSETAAANSFNTLMRSIGTSASAAVIGVVLSQLSIDFAGRALPSQAGLRTGLLLGGGVAVLAAALALTIPRRTPIPVPTPPQPAPAGR